MSRDDEPINLADLCADDELIEQLRAGAEPPTDDQVAALLAQLRERGQGR